MAMEPTKGIEKIGNESQHNDFSLSGILDDIQNHLGIVLVAEAGHGKSFTAFSIVKEALKDENLTVIVMSPSSIWRRNYGAIKCVKVGTNSFNPILVNDEADVETVNFLRDTVHINLDKKYSYVKSAWLEDLLQSKQSFLFDIKYKNGRRIKAFESIVLEFLYDMQAAQIDKDPEYKHHYLIVLEEIQNCFGTYSMNSDDSLELFTIFTQSRSDANLHYVAIGQRLNDVSCKVVERLRPLIGLTLGENSIRKLKAMIPDDATKKRIQQLPKRHWIYLDGKLNPEIEIPLFKKEGTVTYLKPIIEQQPEKRIGFFRALWNFQKLNYEAGQRKYKINLPEKFKKWDESINDPDPQTSETGESDPKFPSSEVYNVKVHALKPVMRDITSEVKKECDGQVCIDLKKCLDLEMFRLEVYYRMNESSLSALVHSRSSPEPFKQDKRYHLSAQLIDPNSLVSGFSEVDVEDYPVEARIHIQEKIDTALPSLRTFKRIRKIENEMLGTYDPHKSLEIIRLQKTRHALKKRLAQENPIEALRDLMVFLRPSKFLTYLNVLDDFRLHECSWGSGFMEVATNISLPEEMVVVTRQDLNLKKQAAKGILEYHESAFSDDVKQILNTK